MRSRTAEVFVQRFNGFWLDGARLHRLLHRIFADWRGGNHGDMCTSLLIAVRRNSLLNTSLADCGSDRP